MASPTGAAALAAHGRALRSEALVLERRPVLTWTQLHNRLQWGDDDGRGRLGRERQRRSRPGAPPWLRTRTPFVESRALVGRLGSHGGRVNGCAFAPDGSFAATAGTDATVRIWDLDVGQERLALRAGGVVRSCAVSPTGTVVVSAADDAVVLWEAQTGHELRQLGDAGANGAAFSPDGTFVVVATDEALTLWDPTTGERIRSIPVDSRVTSCAVGTAGRPIVSGDYSRRILLWDPTTGAQVAALGSWSPDDLVERCALSPDGRFVVSCGFENTLDLWDVEAGTHLRTLSGHTRRVWDCAVGPDGRVVVSAAMDGTLRVWAVDSGDALAALDAHTAGATACAVGPDGATAVSGGEDGTVLVWDLTRSLGTDEDVGAHSGDVLDCALGPDGSVAVSASRDRTVRVWDTASGAVRACLTGHADQVNACRVSPDGDSVVSASSDGTLSVWEPGSGEERARMGVRSRFFRPYAHDPGEGGAEALREALGTLRHAGGPGPSGGGHTGPVTCCAVSPDGAVIVSGGEDHTMRLWAPSGELLASNRGRERLIRAVEIAPDGSYAATIGGEDPVTGSATLSLWDLRDGQERAVLVGHEGAVTAVAVSPDGAFVVSGATDGTVRLWEPVSGRERLVLVGHEGAVDAVAVSPDGAFVVSGATDGTVRLWEPVSGRERLVLVGHQGPVTTVAVTADAAFVLSGGVDGMLRVWDAGTGGELAAVGLLGPLHHLCAHPRAPTVVAHDTGRNLYIVDLVGVPFSTPVVTARAGPEPVVRCPACLDRHELRPSDLGQVVECPRCSQPLRVAPSTVRAVRPDRSPAPSGAASERVRRETLLAQASMARQDWAGAVDHYTEALRLQEEGAGAGGRLEHQARATRSLLYGERGNAQAHRGDYPSALADYDEALGLEPGSAHYLDQRARVRVVAGDPAGAVEDFTEALAHLPDDDDRAAEIHLYRAHAHAESGDVTAARRDLDAAARAHPSEALAAGIEQVRREIERWDLGW
ncbi:MAG: hypothetical protein KDB10_05090 [Acidimicrobiales bacterium]|nr:hypothetical protein [Acidimicrobiales bacterium]